MTALERLIAYFAPGRALERAHARAVLEGYKGAKTDRTITVRRENRDPNSPVQADAISLRERARGLEHDSDIARHALDILVNKTIGTGLVPEPMVMLPDGSPATELNEQLSALYGEWSERPEVSHRHSNVGAQRIAARTLFRDGEVFIRHIEGNVRNLDHYGRIPYSFELIEPDLIPMDLHQGNIVQGITLNAWRQEKAYHVLSDYQSGHTYLLPRQLKEHTHTVSADVMDHLALLDRIAQIRGVSQFASVILRLDDIAEIDESERVAARVAAAMCAVIVKGEAAEYNAAQNGNGRHITWKPGQVFDDLLPGERVETMLSNRPNNQVIEFRDANVRAAAGGLGVGFSHLANSYQGSYSSQRQELVEQEIQYSVLSEYFISRMERPKYRRFVSMAVAAGLVDGWRDADQTTLLDAWFTAPAMPWVDPAREMDAVKTSIELGVTSLPRVQRERGLSPREVLRERAIADEAERAVMGEPEPAQDAPPVDEESTEDEQATDGRHVIHIR